jgi:TolB-like protein
LSFWAELRRRSVFRVAGVYAVVGWLLAQAAALAEDAVGLPAWFDGAVVTLIVLGLPLALVLAWAFELTPEGVRRAAPATEGAPAPGLGTADVVIVAAIALVAGAAVVQTFVRPAAVVETAAAADARPSIAVLPFADMSPEGDQEYFSDGLSEELLNQLAQLEGLRVIGRTSSFAFKGQNTDLRAIGEALDVATILEGSVRKDRDRLRITAQLIDASNGAHLWSRTYERELDDVFAIQDDISRAVAEALRVTLGVAAQRPRVAGTDSVEAYDAYLRGKALGRDGVGGTSGDPVESIRQLERAVEIDPEFAAAWAELSASFGIVALSAASQELQAQGIAGMERAALRAVEVAPDAWESHAAVGLLRIAQRRWLEADAAYARARRLADARGANMGQSYWGYLVQAGWFDETLAYLEETRRLDPIAPNVASAIQNIDFILGRSDAPAIGALGESGAFKLAYDLKRGDTAAVEANIQIAVDAGVPGAVELAESWRDPAAMRELNRAIVSTLGYRPRSASLEVAAVAEAFGDTELALEMLRDAFLESDAYSLYWVIWMPLYEDTRATPGFKDFLRDVGLVALWRETGTWGGLCRPLGPDDFECS